MHFEESISLLNDRQREAVEHVDGPLLVVAGPGTGKTQLLSLRAAHILNARDVAPRNILCLTYTDSGAEAMRKRLLGFVGRDAYGIAISTFHSFALSVRSRHPEHFSRAASGTTVSELMAHEMVNGYLKALPYGSPLSASRGGLALELNSVTSFIGRMKRSGITPDACRRMLLQNVECADYLDADDELMGMLNRPVPGKAAAKEEYVNRFADAVHAARAQAPRELRLPILSTPGIWEPYVLWLDKLVSATELIDGRGRTAGFQRVRDSQFKRGDDGVRHASVRAACEKALVACDAYERYQGFLDDRGLVDYDDMVMDCIAAMESCPELRHELQDRYQYVQVDEFQDTNGAQMRLVELLCDKEGRPNVMAVGDDDHAIMRFQGASVKYIEQFQERFDPRVVVLDTNYRSTPNIVSLGSLVASQISHRLPAKGSGQGLCSHRDAYGQATITEVTFPTPDLERQALARDIRTHLDTNLAMGPEGQGKTIAVIGAKHRCLRALIPHLIQEGVPFDYEVRKSVLEMESLQALVATLRFVAAYSKGDVRLAESYLPQIVASPEFGGNHPSSVAVALEARREHGGRWLEALAQSDDRRVRELYADLTSWGSVAPATPVRRLIFDIAQKPMAYYASVRGDDPYSSAEFNAGIRNLIDFARAETKAASRTGLSLRLADVIERLDQAALFGIDLDASISLGTDNAVRLTTAHSSKGLEFDLVYVIDADDKTWHSSARSSNLYPPNMLVGDERDEDDARRLLYVALTRAKSELKLYRGDGDALRELADESAMEGLVKSVEGSFDESDLSRAIQTDWRQSYAFDTPELVALLGPRPLRHLSASSLNRFVRYEDGVPACASFPEEQILRLPEPPAIQLDFGSIVHSYLEEYVNRVIRASDAEPDAVTAAYRHQVVEMELDYPKEDVRQYLERFDRIAEAFGDLASGSLDGRLETEVAVSAVAGDDVPLFGICDLLVVDDEAKTVRVIDYKTGQSYPKGAPEPDYERQLRFYRLLIESSSEYAGYQVASCENWYVEPDRRTGQMREPVVASVADDEIEQLTSLVNAVWHRICASSYDTSAFELSDLKAEAVAMGGKNAKARQHELQLAYERWLVSEDHVDDDPWSCGL